MPRGNFVKLPPAPPIKKESAQPLCPAISQKRGSPCMLRGPHTKHRTAQGHTFKYSRTATPGSGANSAQYGTRDVTRRVFH